MANLVILLTLPESVRRQFYDRLRAKFPEVNVSMVDHHSKAQRRTT